MGSHKKVVWLPHAKEELFEILEFYRIRNGSTEYGVRLYERMEHRLSLVGDDRLVGEKVDKKGVRRTVVEKFLIYYLITPDSIDVLSVRDGRRKPKRFE